MNQVNNIPLYLIGVLLTGAVAGLWYFSSVSTNQKGPDLLPDDVRLRLQNVKYTSTENGVPKWTLTAAWAQRQGTDGLIRAGDVRVVLYGREGQVVLTADRGEILSDHIRIRVMGNVKIRRSDGALLLTDHLEYSEDDDAITTDAIVHFSVGEFRVTGRGMYLDVKRQQVRILSDVEAVMGSMSCLYHQRLHLPLRNSAMALAPLSAAVLPGSV